MNTTYNVINSGDEIKISSILPINPCETYICTDCIGSVNAPSILNLPDNGGTTLPGLDTSMFISKPIPPGSPTSFYNCAAESSYMNIDFNFNDKLMATYLSGIQSTGIQVRFKTKGSNGCGNWGRYRIFAIKKLPTTPVQYRDQKLYNFDKILLSYGEYTSPENTPMDQIINVRNVFKLVQSQVLFSVDMGNLIDLGSFRPDWDFISVGGSFQQDPYLYLLNQVPNSTIYTGKFSIDGGYLSKLEYHYNLINGDTLEVFPEYSLSFQKYLNRYFFLEAPAVNLPVICFENQCSGYSQLPSTSYAFRDWRSIKLDASTYFSIHAPETGKLKVWGQATDTITDQNVINAGITNVPDNATGLSFVNAGSLNIFAVNKQGTGFAWGDNSRCLNNIPNNLGSVYKIVGCDYAAIALKENLRITGWGCGTEYNNWNGWTGIIDQLQNTDIIDIEAGKGFLLALTNEGNVICWGINSTSGEFTKSIEKMPQPYTILNSGGFSGYYLGVSGLNDVKRIVGGREFVVGISGRKYNLFGWGSGAKTDFGSGPKYYYRSGVSIPYLEGTKYVSAGDFNAQAISSKEELHIWGVSGNILRQNELSYGQYLTKWPNSFVYECAAGLRHSLALRSSGVTGCELIRWGQGFGVNFSDSITGIYNSKKLDYCFYKQPNKAIYLDSSSIHDQRHICQQNIMPSNPASCAYTGTFCTDTLILSPYYFDFSIDNICGTTYFDLEGSLLVHVQGGTMNEVVRLVPHYSSYFRLTLRRAYPDSSLHCRTYKIKVLENNLTFQGSPINLIVNNNPIIYSGCNFCPENLSP